MIETKNWFRKKIGYLICMLTSHHIDSKITRFMIDTEARFVKKYYKDQFYCSSCCEWIDK